MKVLHISSSLGGGASLAARRLRSAQADSGMNAELIARTSGGETPDTGELLVLLSKFKNLRSQKNTVLQQRVARTEFGLVTPHSESVVEDHFILAKLPDIIHIHNWYNFLSIEQIGRLGSRVPLVFTMHDERLLTGGCHYTLTCNGYMNDCNNCPAVKSGDHKIAKAKADLARVMSRLPNFSLIAPSKWLINRASESQPLLHSRQKVVIANILGEEFYNVNKKVSEEKELILVFASAVLNSPYKGLRLLIDALVFLDKELVKSNTSLKVQLVGNGSPIEVPNELKAITIEFLGGLSPSAFQSVLEKASLFVIPSIIDNAPSVISEAQILGVPVIGTKVGGIGEMLDDGRSGYLCEPHPADLARMILQTLLDPELKSIAECGRLSALVRHEPSEIVKKHLDVYQSLLSC